MSQCNYCLLRQLKKRAKKIGLTVTKAKATDMKQLGGYNIFVHPKEVTGTDRLDRKYFKAWLMRVGTKCEC